MCLNISGIEVKTEPRTITVKKAVEKKKDVKRKARHCRSRNKDGGLYNGRGGNKGCVREGGTAAAPSLLARSLL